jgi:hypothetical protein
MQKQALALGYFFLAVFCMLTSAHSFVEFRIPLLIAALLAVIAGVGYISTPLSAIISLVWRGVCGIPSWLVGMVRLAQQPPRREHVSNDEKSF